MYIMHLYRPFNHSRRFFLSWPIFYLTRTDVPASSFCLISKYKFLSVSNASVWCGMPIASTHLLIEKMKHVYSRPITHPVIVQSTNSPMNSRRTFSVQECLYYQQSFGEKLIQAAPSGLKPYLKLSRINNPTGTLLLLWPCLWSISLSADAGHWPSASHLALFFLGAFLMRGAGCTINDMWDQDIDSKVERTKLRPLAAGKIQFSDALGFLAFQLGCATMVLLQLNWYSILLGCCSMGLVVVYPLAKRFTNWPQLVLGLTFNWGALLGWASVRGSCDWFLLLPLYAAGISWTMIYDTIYAHQDKKDDIKLGIKSTALLFGANSKKWLCLFSSSMLAHLVLMGVLSGQTWPFYASTGLAAGHLLWQVATLNVDNPDDCIKKFHSNGRLGIIIFLGIVSGTLLKESDKKSIESNER